MDCGGGGGGGQKPELKKTIFTVKTARCIGYNISLKKKYACIYIQKQTVDLIFPKEICNIYFCNSKSRITYYSLRGVKSGKFLY